MPGGLNSEKPSELHFARTRLNNFLNLADAAQPFDPDVLGEVASATSGRGADAAHRSWASPPFQLDGGLTTAGYPIASPALQQVDEVGSTGSSPEDSFDSSRSHGKALCEPSPMR